jgi:hypothetical protein
MFNIDYIVAWNYISEHLQITEKQNFLQNVSSLLLNTESRIFFETAYVHMS